MPPAHITCGRCSVENEEVQDEVDQEEDEEDKEVLITFLSLVLTVMQCS